MDEAYKLTSDEKGIYMNHYIVGSTEKLIQEEINESRSRGADIVIVMMHWGFVNTFTPSSKMIEIGQSLANMGADYIVGSHPHVLQKHDIINAHDGRKVPIIYSMGNFIHSMDQAEDHKNRDGIILILELNKDSRDKMHMAYSYIPCYSCRKFKGNRHVILPCDRMYNGGYSSKSLTESKKRIKKALGESIHRNKSIKLNTDADNTK